jgi:xanthine/CO dehydrogenase XdhC/CoxF family maturation factor
MSHAADPLATFYATYRDRGEPLVLATIVHTVGSTYRKAGAQMLIAQDDQASGLLSGGCLEGDLAERARNVFATGAATIAEYDTRTSDDLIWGIGLGCEGAMRILLSAITPANRYQPFGYVQACREAHRAGAFAMVVESRTPERPLGKSFVADGNDIPAELAPAMREPLATASEIDTREAKYLLAPVELPLRLLILGAGPDVQPLVEVGGLLGWQITVQDHRPAYVVAERFPRARAVLLNPAGQLAKAVNLNAFDAAVVMSHHLLSDQAYLEALADSPVGYVGLLGPAPRRTRLLAEIGDRAAKIQARLRGPVGLDIGASTPESIALAIAAEIQAYAAHKGGGPFSRRHLDDLQR